MKAALAALATAMTLAAFVPYIRGILGGAIRPHVFSWVIWGITTLIVFVAQWRAGGGAGAWAIGVSAAISLLIAGLAWAKRGDRAITAVDWAFLAAALMSLPVWYVTADPLWAALILTVVDLLGFGPSLRASWATPHKESAGFFAWFALRNGVVVLAMEVRSLTTLVFPVVVGAACVLLAGLILLRRRSVSA